MHVGHTHHHLHSLRHSSLVFYTSQLSVDTLDAFPLSVAFAQCSIQDKEQWAGKKTIAGESKGPRRATLGTLREARGARSYNSGNILWHVFFPSGRKKWTRWEQKVRLDVITGGWANEGASRAHWCRAKKYWQAMNQWQKGMGKQNLHSNSTHRQCSFRRAATTRTERGIQNKHLQGCTIIQ